jgi:hypothetical protein
MTGPGGEDPRHLWQRSAVLSNVTTLALSVVVVERQRRKNRLFVDLC